MIMQHVLHMTLLAACCVIQVTVTCPRHSALQLKLNEQHHRWHTEDTCTARTDTMTRQLQRNLDDKLSRDIGLSNQEMFTHTVLLCRH